MDPKNRIWAEIRKLILNPPLKVGMINWSHSRGHNGKMNGKHVTEFYGAFSGLV